MRRTLPAGLVLFAALSAPAADSWPHWRGPLATGEAPAADPPAEWDAATGKNIRWKAALTSRGSATPIVWGDQVFVVAAEKTDREAKPEERPKADPNLERKTEPPAHFYRFTVTSFDRNTGKKRWEKVAAEKVPHEGHHNTHSYAAGSPTTDGKRLYVSFGSFGVFAYTLDGEKVWGQEFGRLATRLGWGEAVTPVVAGDSLLLNWDQEVGSRLVCVDAATGKTKWETPRDEKSTWTTPLVVPHGGKTLVVLNGTTRARAYDLATGKQVWAAGGMTTNAIPSAVTDGATAYLMSGYRGAAVMAVPLASAGDLGDAPKVIWKYGKGAPYVPSPLLMGGRLYFTEANNAVLTVLDAKTGKVLTDRERLPGVNSFYGSPVGAAGRVYLADRQGTTVVLTAADKPEVLATNRLGDPIDASPAVVGKQLFLRGTKYLYCIEAK